MCFDQDSLIFFVQDDVILSIIGNFDLNAYQNPPLKFWIIDIFDVPDDLDKKEKKSTFWYKKRLVIFLTSGFNEANLTLNPSHVLITGQPNPVGQFSYTLTVAPTFESICI